LKTITAKENRDQLAAVVEDHSQVCCVDGECLVQIVCLGTHSRCHDECKGGNRTKIAEYPQLCNGPDVQSKDWHDGRGVENFNKLGEYFACVLKEAVFNASTDKGYVAIQNPVLWRVKIGEACRLEEAVRFIKVFDCCPVVSVNTGDVNATIQSVIRHCLRR
jgi:hypothetical protein